jgi:hypothetical protein
MNDWISEIIMAPEETTQFLYHNSTLCCFRVRAARLLAHFNFSGTLETWLENIVLN